MASIITAFQNVAGAQRNLMNLCLLSWTLLTSCVVLDTRTVVAQTTQAERQQQSEQTARSVFADALAVWHLGDLQDSAGKPSNLSVVGDAELAMPLSGSVGAGGTDPGRSPDREASLVRGGDGLVAELNGGFLNAGQGAEGELELTGQEFTWLIRLKISQRSLWATRGFFTKGGGHDQLVFNFFSHDFEQGPELMRVGFELGIAGKSGLGGQVMTHVDRIGFEDWHDLIARYDGKSLTLFVDGVNLDSRPVEGLIRQGNVEPVALGAGTYQGQADNCFPGLIDHAAIWGRALTDAEIVLLSGGADAVGRQTARFADYRPPQPQASTWELVQKSRELKSRFMADHHRPRFHFLVPEEGDIMPADPNGAIWWKGRYHLFYIFQRFQQEEPQTVHCWGHASSVDLVHWEHHPTALDVAPSDPDRGIFSGNAFVSLQGVPTILYHGVALGNSIAESQDDGLLTWKKSPANPIVPIPKPGDADHGRYESWDPHGWTEGSQYFAVFGGAKPALFRGPALNELKYQGTFLSHDRWSESIEDISCPDFFPIGDQHMLLCISHCRGARYFLGAWDGVQFRPESHGRMNWPGGGFFAPETMLDHQGRRILWAWCMDERPPHVRAQSGWSGVMSLPRILSLDERGLRIEPAPELRSLRWNPRQRKNLDVADQQVLALPDFAGDQLELDLRIPRLTAAESGLIVRQSPDGTEQTRIIIDRDRNELRIDVSKSTLDPQIRYRTWCITRPDDPADASRKVTEQIAPLTLAPDETVHLNVFLDHSMLEVFVNGRQCVTQRVWPTQSNATGVSLFSIGGATTVDSIEAWNLESSR